MVLLSITLSLFGSGEWLYYKHYPWVYDNVSKDWLYLRGSGDGKIYAYRASTNAWEEFDANQTSPNNFEEENELTFKLTSTVDLEMLWVNPGSFTMGSPSSEDGRNGGSTVAGRDFEIQHQVTLSKGLYLGKYEVTQAQYEAVMGTNPSEIKGANKPVELVSWDDSQVFVTNINEQLDGVIDSDYKFILPTESEWEYACRAGTTTAYSWGSSINSNNANYGKIWNEVDAGIQNVGQYQANAWGFYDMHGNASEWVSDLYAFYPQDPVTDPDGYAYTHVSALTQHGRRITRGGDWGGNKYLLRSASRSQMLPKNKYPGLGFRIALKKSN